MSNYFFLFFNSVIRVLKEKNLKRYQNNAAKITDYISFLFADGWLVDII
jgi:hypothetical protein